METDIKSCIVCGRTEKENVQSDFIVQLDFDIASQTFNSEFFKPKQKSIDKSILKQGINYLCSSRQMCDQRKYTMERVHRWNFPYENLKEEHALFILKNIISVEFEWHSFTNIKDRKFYLVECDNEKYSLQINYNGDIFFECMGNSLTSGLTYLKIYNYLQSVGYPLPKTR